MAAINTFKQRHIFLSGSGLIYPEFPFTQTNSGDKSTRNYLVIRTEMLAKGGRDGSTGEYSTPLGHRYLFQLTADDCLLIEGPEFPVYRFEYEEGVADSALLPSQVARGATWEEIDTLTGDKSGWIGVDDGMSFEEWTTRGTPPDNLSIIAEIDTPEKHGAIGGGADDTNALQEWALSKNPNKAFTGDYKTKEPLDMRNCKTLIGSGRIYGEVPNGSRAIIESSGDGIEYIGTAIAIAGTRRIYTTSVTGLSSGDLIKLWQPDDYSWCGHRAYYRDGEFARILFINGLEIVVDMPLYSSYLSEDTNIGRSATRLYKVNTKSIRITGGVIEAQTSAGAIKLTDMCDTHVDVTALGGNYKTIAINGCYDFSIAGRSRNTATADSEQYG